MIGDIEDFVRRMRVALPNGWFDSQAPVLQSLLRALATPWAGLYEAAQYAARQTRIATASDTWLDMIAGDFFGRRMRRSQGQSDETYRTAIQSEILRERATRSGVARVILDLTGRSPTLFEPGHCGDTGAYGACSSAPQTQVLGFAYCCTGAWGSMNHPFQIFITAFRPVRVHGENGCGWGDGGYNLGRSAYVDSTVIQGAVTDADIHVAIARVLPACTVAWTRILG